MAPTKTKRQTKTGAGPRAKRVRVPKEGPLTPEQGVTLFKRLLDRGQPWYPSLLEVVARWSAPEEEIEGVTYRYLIAGEAFDWLLLAERLIEEAGDAIPAWQAEQLLLHGIPPDGSSEEDFARAVGPAKHSAHLNFQYGVTVEQLLLLNSELELQKAGRLAGAGQPEADIGAYERVYGVPYAELAATYRTETGAEFGERVSQSEFQSFIYWCSKYRLRMGEPARVASDTRKALALMSRLEGGRARLGGSASAKAPVVIDL
jgi:hypothetical protein